MMHEGSMWHGHEITEKEAKWLNRVVDLMGYCIQLRDGRRGLGVPAEVPREIRDEMKILIDRCNEMDPDFLDRLRFINEG